MIAPDFAAFTHLAQQGNFVPVYQEWIADLDTPVSAWYRVCAGHPYSFLLESVEGGERVGRYSLLGCNPLWVLETRGSQTVQTFRDGSQTEFQGDPFGVLSQCVAPYQPVHLPQLPPGIGGLFGFWGYELIQWIESRVPVGAASPEDLPDGCWMQVDSLLIFDQAQRKIWAIAYADLQTQPDLALAYGDACRRVEALVDKLQQPLPQAITRLQWSPPGGRTADATGANATGADTTGPDTTGANATGANATGANATGDDRPLSYTSNTTREEFCAHVQRAKEYIRAGDIFQVVLSQRLSMAYGGDPFGLYRSLRLINPSPYMAYFQFGTWQVIGSSPEIMVKAEKDPLNPAVTLATVRPIAGTRKRGQTPQEDLALEQDLLADPKELAEHVMLVDLGRNDLGRVCHNGTVRVDELMAIERYSHVMHIVSNVVGHLRDNQTAWDLLKACFPAGTVSGAPKIRAMEIIHELEPCRRGVYAGVYGYYDFEGQLNTAIAIRTMVVRPQGEGQHQVMVQAGAGVVADSDPQKEYEETLNKARGMLEAVRCLQSPGG